eukprot:Hpha_TRINITY_DN13524_c0_g1::TRINITY_DN13524_c0_g1_i1::g.111339::m.111339
MDTIWPDSVVAATSRTKSSGLIPRLLASVANIVIRKETFLIVYYAALIYLARWSLLRLGVLDQSRSRQVPTKRGGKIVANLTRDEDQLCGTSVIDPSDLFDTLASVGGLSKVKQVVEESVVLPLASPHLFPQGTLRSPPKGVLLYGPPGTGKTLVAKAVAKEAQATFVSVRLDTIMQKWVGESEKRVVAVFSLARKLAPTVLFIDEIDAVLGQRGTSGGTETYNQVKTVFLTEWDGISTDEKQHRVIVLAATNRPGDIDEAVLRRLPVKLRVNPPTQAEREEILSIILRRDQGIDAKSFESLSLSRIAMLTQGHSGSDLRELCKEAAMCAVREQIVAARSAAGTDAPLREIASAVSAGPILLREEHFKGALTVVRSNQGFVCEQRPFQELGLD